MPDMEKRGKKKSKELTPQPRQGMPEAAVKGRQKWGRSVPGQAVQGQQEQAEAEKLPH